MGILGFTDYKAYVEEQLTQWPKAGRGAYQRMAEHLKTHPSLLTQVFRGPKDLSLEHAHRLAEFLGLNDFETGYFILLVQLARAGEATYRAYLLRQIEQLRGAKEATGAQGGGKSDLEFDRASQTIFYSAWYFSAVHLMTTIKSAADVAWIAEELDLPAPLVKGVLEFLVSCGLCEVKNGRYRARVLSTLLVNEPQLSTAHNTNWRHRGVQRLPKRKLDDYFFTSVVSISDAEIAQIRAVLETAAARAVEIVNVKTPCSRLYCLNVDWFGV